MFAPPTKKVSKFSLREKENHKSYDEFVSLALPTKSNTKKKSCAAAISVPTAQVAECTQCAKLQSELKEANLKLKAYQL